MLHCLFLLCRTEENEATLLEIKCPHSRKHQKLTKEPLLYFLEKTPELALKKKHTYYAQIQISLYVLKLRQCWLYVYTTNDSLTLKIDRDEAFLAEAIPKLREFYFTRYLTCLNEIVQSNFMQFE